MFEKTEGAIKNGQSYWVHKTQDEDKQNTTPKINKMSNSDTTKSRGEDIGALEGEVVPVSFKTLAMLPICSRYEFIVEDTPVNVKCKALCPYFNLFLSVILDILPCLFSSYPFLQICISYANPLVLI
jgi:hypothetical protein